MFNYSNVDKALKLYLDSFNVKRVIQSFTVVLWNSWRTHKTQIKKKKGKRSRSSEAKRIILSKNSRDATLISLNWTLLHWPYSAFTEYFREQGHKTVQTCKTHVDQISKFKWKKQNLHPLIWCLRGAWKTFSGCPFWKWGSCWHLSES